MPATAPGSGKGEPKSATLHLLVLRAGVLLCDGCTAAVTESRTLAGLCATSTARGRCGHPTPPPAPGSRFTSIGRQTSQEADSDRDHRWSRQRRLAEPLDDSGDVGHPAALTHRPQPIALSASKELRHSKAGQDASQVVT